jgi:hypothetical protein
MCREAEAASRARNRQLVRYKLYAKVVCTFIYGRESSFTCSIYLY